MVSFSSISKSFKYVWVFNTLPHIPPSIPVYQDIYSRFKTGLTRLKFKKVSSKYNFRKLKPLKCNLQKPVINKSTIVTHVLNVTSNNGLKNTYKWQLELAYQKGGTREPRILKGPQIFKVRPLKWNPRPGTAKYSSGIPKVESLIFHNFNCNFFVACLSFNLVRSSLIIN